MAGNYRKSKVEGPTKRTSISLPEELMRVVEERADENGRSFTQEVAMALRWYMAKVGTKPVLDGAVVEDFSRLPATKTQAED